MNRSKSIAAWCVLAAAAAGSIAATSPPVLPGPPAFDRAALERELAAFNKLPDTPGTGEFPSLKEEVASLPDHVIYRPADLAKLGKTRLGVLVWGNGACSNDGAGSRMHLAEIASHGYLAIANGKILSGPGAPPQAQPFMPPDGQLPPPQTDAAGLTKAIDWALQENARGGSPYFDRIDVHQIAVSGWSCGGIQALRVAADPRVRAVIIHNSGIFPAGMNHMPGMDMSKDALKALHTPILYVLGGPTDIAYTNGMDDFGRIAHVPAMVANLEVGHGGTFLQLNGGAAATVAVNWLNWQLRGDTTAARLFVGADCGLCRDPRWQVQRRNFETLPESRP